MPHCASEATSNHDVSRQYEEHAHNQQTLFQEFDGAIKHKNATVLALKQELANQKEQVFAELEQARQDAERMANVSRAVFADGVSTQPYAAQPRWRKRQFVQLLPWRNDVTITNLQEACLKLVVLARARALELQVDMQVERAHQPVAAKTVAPITKSKSTPVSTTDKPVCPFFLKPDGCKNGDNCQYAHPRTKKKKASVCDAARKHTVFKIAPVHAVNNRLGPESRSGNFKPAPKKEYSKAKGKTAEAQTSKAPSTSDKSRGKGTYKREGQQEEAFRQDWRG